MAEREKTKTVKFITNIGTSDTSKYHLDEAYQDGDIVDLPESVADQCIAAGVAVEYTDEVKKADEEAAKKAEEDLVASVLPEVAQEEAKEKAKAEAKKKLKEGPAKKHTPQTHAAPHKP